MMVINGWSFVMSLVTIAYCEASYWSELKLSPQHIPYFFNNNNDIQRLCNEDPTCPYKDATGTAACWGYEQDCPTEHRYHHPQCPDSSEEWTSTKTDQVNLFWVSADFGYIGANREELTILCERKGDTGSHLQCIENARLCLGRKIYIDLRRARLAMRTSHYVEEILKPGDIGGDCQVEWSLLLEYRYEKSPLQSWYAELEHFGELKTAYETCDVVLDKPTILIKIDAVVNLFHHFCDFVNLYASQHFNNSFSRDVYIIVWDTCPMRSVDLFNVTWSVFTKHPVMFLPEFDGKRLCLDDALFSFLPRMHNGLYYNMPLVPGCHSSGLMRAFNEHVLYRLGVERTQASGATKIRVTWLSRETLYRNVQNEEELLAALRENPLYEVERVVYNSAMPFIDQLNHTYNTDIFIGMHGAGLTHALFLPDWGVLFELYHCGDTRCYYDLARLRGVKYMTSLKHELIPQDEGHHPTLGAHEKFTNYSFLMAPFMEKMSVAAQYVASHPRYVEVTHGMRISDEL